jgi:23S rRNA pseudouridine1911/1915/1917 synthase
VSGAGPSPRRWAARAGADAAGARVDRWLAASLPELSRVRLKALIDAGAVRVDGRATKASHRLRGGERLEADIPPPPPETLVPEPIPLLVVLEDDHLLVVDKPAGMVTHPGAGQPAGTLAAAALAHAPGMAGVGGPRRPGIVHRLDKGTSGLIVLAKSAAAYASLTAQLARRTVSRGYLCLVWGIPRRDAGVVDAPIARDPRSRVRMAMAPPGKGKGAVTRYQVLERFRLASGGVAYLECQLGTGRTHQIRVHLASLGHPLIGDHTYDRRRPRPEDPALARLIENLDGVALHATRLRFVHPVTGAPVELVSPLPARLSRLLSHLRSLSASAL